VWLPFGIWFGVGLASGLDVGVCRRTAHPDSL
jgi:hypothetical protein